MVCILFMLIWPKTKVSSSKRLSSECPVCCPHSKTMATAWCQGKKPLCLSMPIAYLFLNREAVRSQVPWVLHIQAFISSLACRKAGRFIHWRNNRMGLSSLPFNLADYLQKPRAFRCEQLRLWALGRWQECSPGTKATHCPLQWGISYWDFLPPLRAGTQLAQERPQVLHFCLRVGSLGSGPGNLTGLPSPQGYNLWLWPN